MASINDIRKVNPAEYGSLTDYEIVDKLSQITGRHPDAISDELGVPLKNDPGFFTSAKSGLGSMAQGVGQIAGDFVPGVENNNAVELYGRNVTQRNPVTLMDGDGNALENIGHNLVESPWLTAKQVAGQAVGFMGPGIGLKAVTTASRAIRGINTISRAGRIGEGLAQSAMFGLPSVAQLRDAQEAKGENSAVDLLKAYGSALAVGKIETMGGAEKALTAGALNKTSGSLLKSIGKSGLEEAGEEIVQTPIEAYGSGDDPFTKDVAINAAAGGVAGFVGGGIFGAGSHPFAKARDAKIAADLDARKQVDLLQAEQAAPNPARVMAEGQQRGAEIQNQFVRDRIAQDDAVEQNSVAAPQAINDLVGVNVKGKGKKDSLAAFNEQLPNPVVLPDENGKPFSTTDAYHQYLYDNGIPIPAASVNSKNNKAPKAEVAPAAVTPVQQFLAEVGMPKASYKKQEYASQYLKLVNDGVVTREQADDQFLAALDKGHFAKIDKMFNVASMAAQTNTSAAPIQESATSADISQPTPPISRDASPVEVLQFAKEAHNKLLEGTNKATRDALYTVHGKRNVDDSGWELDEHGNEIVPTSTRAAAAMSEDVSSNKTVSNRSNSALATIAKNAETLGISVEAAHQILGIQGEPVIDVGPTAASIHVASTNNQDYSENDTTTEDFTPESNVGIDGNFDAKENENGDVAPEEEGDSYEVDHSLKDKDYENATDIWEMVTQGILQEGGESVADWESITAEARQDFAKLVRGELLHASGQSSLNRIQTLYEAIIDGKYKSDTRATEADSVGPTEPRSEAAPEGSSESDIPAQQAEEPVRQATETQKQPASATGTETSEVDDTAALLKSLKELSKDKNKGAIAKDYLARAMRGEPVEEEARDWVNAVKGDAGLKPMASKGVAFSAAEQKSGFIGNALDLIYKEGLGAIFLDMRDFSHTDQKDQGLFIPREDGTFVITLKTSMVKAGNKEQISHVIRHELSHAVDFKTDFALSGHPGMELSIDDYGQITPKGNVISEIMNLRAKGVTGIAKDLADYFNYPLAGNTSDTDAFTVQAEVFAQLHAAWMTNGGKNAINLFLPKAAIYLKAANTYAKQQLQTDGSRGAEETPKTTDGQSRATTGHNQTGALASKGDALTDAYDKVVDSLPSKAQEPIRYVTDSIKSGLKNALHSSMFTSHLVEKVSKIMPSAQTWYDAVNAREVARTKFEAKIDAIADKVDKLDNASRKKVWTHILESTANQAWGYKPDWKDVAINDTAKKDFEALSTEEQALVKEVFKHGADTLKETQRLLDEQLDTTYADKLERAKTPEAKAQLEKEKDKFRKMFGRKLSEMEGPYAPMRRVGSHVVVAKSQAYLDAIANGDKSAAEKMKSDREHFHVEFHQSYAQAKRAQRVLETKFAKVEASEKEKTNFEDAMPFQAFEKLRGMVDEKNGKAAEKLSRMINEMYLVSLAETSSRKSEMKRANIAGLNAETTYKAFLSKGKADAHYLSVLQHHKAISSAYGVMRSELHDGKGDKEERSAIYNELTQRYENSFNYEPSPLVGRLMGLNSTWMLLTKPAYYFYNATQPLMMSQPYMAQKYGYGTSMSALFKAYGELKQMPSFGKFGNMDLEGAPADVKQALVELRNMGRLDITLTQELGARIHSSEFETARKAAGWVTKMRGFAQKVEMTNRIVTASAAYRMAVKDMGHAKAVEYAKDVIDNTHGDYSNFNAPRLMNQNSFARMVTQFRKFQLIQLSLLVREYKNMMQGATAADKWALSKALRYTLAHHAIIAGGLGLPCANLVALAFGAMGDDDDKKDLELSVREAIGDEFTASLLLHGVPSIVNINMSGNVGAGQMLSILPYQDIDFSGRDKAASTLVAMAGPLIGGTAMQAADAIKQGGNGEYYKMIMGLAPSGMKSALRAGLEAVDGVTNTKGDVTVSPEEITMWDTALKAVGIRTESDSIRQMVQSDKYNFEQFFNDRTHKLKNQYAKAYKDGDGEAMEEIRDHWNAMQGFKRDYGFKAQPISNLLKAPAEQRKREHDTLGGVQYRKQDKGFVQQATDSED